MVKARLLRVGVVTAGMDGWAAARAVLDGRSSWLPAPLPRFKPVLLPANERRRATWLVQLALRAVEDCLIDVPASPSVPAPHSAPAAAASPAQTAPRPLGLDALASVFASSGGDMGNLHGLCEQLVRDPKGISPTAFHNSVHNAVAGYFGIGAVARAPSVSLSAHDHSLLAGLQEAMAWLADQQSAVLLVAYDMLAPQPLFDKRAVQPDFAVALLLAPAPADAPQAAEAGAAGRDIVSPDIAHWNAHPLAELTLTQLDADAGQAFSVRTQMADPELERLRSGNPAARVLPLLQALATGTSGQLLLGDPEACWQLQVHVL